MDFWQTLLVLMRRWYIAVPVLVLTVGVTGGVFFTVPTQYMSTGTAVLTIPPAGAKVSSDATESNGTVNPLLAFDGSLEVAAKLEIATLSDPAVLQQLAAEGATAVIEAGDGGLSGPFVVINGTSSSSEEAQRTVELGFKHVQKELQDRQSRLGAPRSTYINVELVVSPTAGEPKIGGKVRAAGVALALGLIVSLCSAFMIESFAQRRRGTGSAGGAEPDGTLPPREPVSTLQRKNVDAEATVRVPALSRPSRSGRPEPGRRPASPRPPDVDKPLPQGEPTKPRDRPLPRMRSPQRDRPRAAAPPVVPTVVAHHDRVGTAVNGSDLNQAGPAGR